MSDVAHLLSSGCNLRSEEGERGEKKEQLRREGTQEERLQLDLGGEKVVLSETV